MPANPHGSSSPAPPPLCHSSPSRRSSLRTSSGRRVPRRGSSIYGYTGGVPDTSFNGAGGVERFDTEVAAPSGCEPVTLELGVDGLAIRDPATGEIIRAFAFESLAGWGQV